MTHISKKLKSATKLKIKSKLYFYTSKPIQLLADALTPAPVSTAKAKDSLTRIVNSGLVSGQISDNTRK